MTAKALISGSPLLRSRSNLHPMRNFLWLTSLGFLTLLAIADAQAGPVPWIQKLKDLGVTRVHVCGNSSIRPNLRSVQRDVIMGPGGKGYVLSQMLTHGEYWKLLKENGLEDAKAALTQKFKEAQLWEVSDSGEPKNLGAPIRFEFPMKSTVKDCVNHGEASRGQKCNSNDPTWPRESCCREKFFGPSVFWDGFVLMYSPDPSVRLKVPGERAHRFCDIVRSFDL